jgi:hypothetical protein
MSKVHDDDDNDDDDDDGDGIEEEVKIRGKRLSSVSFHRTIYLVSGGS